MHYISTRGNYPAVSAAEAINLGMVPRGGLFVPERLPAVDPAPAASESYHQTAQRVLEPLLSDFTSPEIRACIEAAYNEESFDIPDVTGIKQISERETVLELWHGPTAAFKDVALQIMPHFLVTAKRKLGKQAHTVILVATSGDTGKAALEGFKNCEGVSIIVFFPDDGVSEIQKLQMVTTDGDNTHVAAVRGNFDDCQTAVKSLFGDERLGRLIAREGFVFSSANSINWGRLCPQIVYYYRAYGALVAQGIIQAGDQINFAVPTGNFGNILAGWYAKRMGVPINRLICASNKNNVLSDFIWTGRYDRNREFFRTMSPSMDILISSNLERYLFEISGRDAGSVTGWYEKLARDGGFMIPEDLKGAMQRELVANWVDETRVLETVAQVYQDAGYVIDTHTAVGVAVNRDREDDGLHTVIDSTASPYKFSSDVLQAIAGRKAADEFQSIEQLCRISGQPVHRGLANLRERPIRHDRVIDIGAMRETVLGILGM